MMHDLQSLVHNFKSKDYSEWSEMLDMVGSVVEELAPAFVQMAQHMAEVSHEQDTAGMLRLFMARLEGGLTYELEKVRTKP